MSKQAALKERFESKPGKHGTLYLFEITYRDTSDHDISFKNRVYRYDLDHVELMFYSEDSDGWELVKAVRLIKNNPSLVHRGAVTNL